MKNKKIKTKVGPVTSAPQNISGECSVSFDVYRQIRADIVTCKLKPNQRLRSDALKADYGAAVGTLREALSHLVSDGLVRTEFGKGFSVSPVSVADLNDITEWRVEFEGRAIAESIRIGGDHWEAELIAAYHLLSKSNVPKFDAPSADWISYSEKHQRFHNALVSNCGSPWLLYFRGALIAQTQRYQSLAYHRSESEVYRSVDDHSAIMEATIGGDVKLAKELIETHIRRTAEIIAEELSSSGVIEIEQLV